MDAVLSFVPPEDHVKYSAMTGQSLFYMGETGPETQGACHRGGGRRASAAYALKLLQSEGALTIASTGKDPGTGRMVTHEYRVEGPVMIFLTTTAIKIDEELLNRCLVLAVDEDREQTRPSTASSASGKRWQGCWPTRTRQEALTLHRNAQRLLAAPVGRQPLRRTLDLPGRQDPHPPRPPEIPDADSSHRPVAPVPAAGEDDRASTTRHVEYIEVTLDDIAVANRLACEVAGPVGG